MSLIAKGIYDITCSIFKGIFHVILRDLTNYYWYLDEIQEENQSPDVNQNGNDEEQVLSNLNDEENSFLVSTQENEPEFVNSNEGEDSPTLFISCTSLNINDYIPENVDEIKSIEDNTMVQIEEDKLRSLKSPINNNCIWTEIKNIDLNVEDINMNNINLNAIKEPITFENIEEKCMINTQSKNINLDMEESSSETNHNNLLDGTNCNMEFVDSVEKEHVLINHDTGDSIFNGDIFEEKEIILKNEDEPEEENIFIGDSKKDKTEFPNNEISDGSSDCGLGIRNFQNQNLQVTPSKKKELKKSKTVKSKISRYIGNNTLPKTKITKQTNTPNKISSITPSMNSASEEIENRDLLPITYCEITAVQPLLNKSQEPTEPEDDNTNVITKPKELEDNLLEISRIPEELSDVGSACSNDSWFSKMVSVIRPKSPVKSVEGSLNKPTIDSKEDEESEDSYHCKNCHTCLFVVDSSDDEDFLGDLLTSEQLGSVETGSVSDWLYRVSPPYPLLTPIVITKENPKEKQNTEEQGEQTYIESESSEEDLAVKKFFIQQWLDNAETNNTGLNTKFIGSGDIM